MKDELIAVPMFQNRVSPLMDVSNKYAIYETIDGEIKHRIDISLNAEGELQRVDKLKEIGVNTIICGAVSGCVARIVDEKGIRLISMIYGPIEKIVEQYLANSLSTYCPGNTECPNKKIKGRKRCADVNKRSRKQVKKAEEKSI